MKLKRIIEQQGTASPYYDVGKDFISFKHTLNSATEEIKNKFEQLISSKLKGKKIRARASRGYKQFQKDYEIDVASISLDDYYDNYVVVVRNPKGKEFFLKTGFKVQILGAAGSDENPQEPQKPQQPTQAQPQEPNQPPQQPEQTPVNEKGEARRITDFSREDIIKDIQTWLPQLLPDKSTDLSKYVPQSGISLINKGKKVITYAITIPVDDVPALTVDQIKQVLPVAAKILNAETPSDNIYKLEKFDIRGDKYMIIIKKVTSV